MGKHYRYFGLTRSQVIEYGFDPDDLPDPETVPFRDHSPIPVSDYSPEMQWAITLKEKYYQDKKIKEEEKIKSHREASRKYQKLNTKSYSLVLNNATDKDLIGLLDQAVNKQRLIKESLRHWMRSDIKFLQRDLLKKPIEGFKTSPEKAQL